MYKGAASTSSSDLRRRGGKGWRRRRILYSCPQRSGLFNSQQSGLRWPIPPSSLPNGRASRIMAREKHGFSFSSGDKTKQLD
ncbi:unnamed protein product [Urochloa humidicola]